MPAIVDSLDVLSIETLRKAALRVASKSCVVEDFILKTRSKLDLIYVISNMMGGGLGGIFAVISGARAIEKKWIPARYADGERVVVCLRAISKSHTGGGIIATGAPPLTEFNLSAIPRLNKYGDGAEFELEGLFLTADAASNSAPPLSSPTKKKREDV